MRFGNEEAEASFLAPRNTRILSDIGFEGRRLSRKIGTGSRSQSARDITQRAQLFETFARQTFSICDVSLIECWILGALIRNCRFNHSFQLSQIEDFVTRATPPRRVQFIVSFWSKLT